MREGWNYIALNVDEIYEYSYVTMYHRSEYTGSPYYTQYSTFFRGYYTETEDDNDADDTVMLVLGCKDYIPYGTYGGLGASIPDESIYGLSMRGWI